MLKTTTKGGAKLILIDTAGTENTAMIQALYARHSVSAEERFREVRELELAAAREAVRKVAANLPDVPPDAILDAIVKATLDVAHGTHPTARARRLHENFRIGYGHSSIGDCGTYTLFAEGVSMLAAKAIQQSPLYNGQEMSTRAVDMTKQPVVDPMGTPETRAIQERWIEFYARAQKPVADSVRARYPRKAGEDEEKYEGAVKYRTFDVTRSILPAGATTNVSLHTTLRHANDHLSFLVNHPLDEVRDVGSGWSALSCERYPSSGDFGREATVSGVGRDGRERERSAWAEDLIKRYGYVLNQHVPCPWTFASELRLDKPIPYGEDTNGTGPNGFSWEADRGFLDARPRGVRLPHEKSDLGSLRWRFLLDFGSFRDLQRHRYSVIRMPLLTMHQGFDPWYVDELPPPVAAELRELLDLQEEQILRLVPDRFVRQYYVAMGYRVACDASFGLPGFAYFAELRSGKTIHPTLRRVVHRMVEDFRGAHPLVKLHVDMDPDGWTVRRGGQDIKRV